MEIIYLRTFAVLFSRSRQLVKNLLVARLKCSSNNNCSLTNLKRLLCDIAASILQSKQDGNVRKDS